MGCEIETVAQRRDEKTGEWIDIQGDFLASPGPFFWRSYSIFAFLAGVRNYSAITPISEPRGLPSDFCTDGYTKDDGGISLGEHNFSWLSVDELLAFDYGKTIEDRRIENGQTCESGRGEIKSLREFLGKGFFNDLIKLKEIDAGRIVFGFDG